PTTCTPRPGKPSRFLRLLAGIPGTGSLGVLSAHIWALSTPNVLRLRASCCYPEERALCGRGATRLLLLSGQRTTPGRTGRCALLAVIRDGKGAGEVAPLGRRPGRSGRSGRRPGWPGLGFAPAHASCCY